MKTMQDIMAEDRRLAILRILREAPSSQANDGVLRHALEGMAQPVSHALLRADLEWLHEHGLVRREPLSETLWLAHLTLGGSDVAAGVSHHPGVARPDPE